MFKQIMLAVDGSAYTDVVLAYGIALAKGLNCRILTTTVADIRIFEWASAVGADGFISIVPSGTYQEESKTILAEKCDKLLARCEQVLGEAGVKYELEKMIGSPVDMLLERSQVIDLMVMGKRGEFARWEQKALGVTVEAVSRMIYKPLLVVNSKYADVKKILVGYDGSHHANCVLHHVGQIAEGLGAAVTLISVSEDADLGKHCCDEALSYLKNYQITTDSQVISGHPDEVLVSYALSNHFDLIAIGAYGHSRIREAILGSTTEHVLRAAHCPVLLAK